MGRKGRLIILFLVLAGAQAFGDQVTILSDWPIPYAHHKTVNVSGAFTLGTSSGINSGPLDVYGDVIDGGSLTFQDTSVVVGRYWGPWGGGATSHPEYDGLNISSSADTVVVGPPSVLPAGTAKFLLKSSTTFSGQNFYVVDNVPSATNKKFGVAWADWDPMLGPQVFVAAMLDNGSYNFANDMLSPQYAPFRIDAYYVNLLDKMLDWIHCDTFGGVQNNVLIGTQTVYTAGGTVPAASVFLQVGSPGDTSQALGNFYQWSSRTFKKDITPFSIQQYDNALTQVSRTPVYNYLFKKDPKGQKPRLGLIAEDSPAEMVDDNKTVLNLSDSYGYLAAALKALIIKNDELKKRLDALEKTKAELEAGLKK